MGSFIFSRGRSPRVWAMQLGRAVKVFWHAVGRSVWWQLADRSPARYIFELNWRKCRAARLLCGSAFLLRRPRPFRRCDNPLLARPMPPWRTSSIGSAWDVARQVSASRNQWRRIVGTTAARLLADNAIGEVGDWDSHRSTVHEADPAWAWPTSQPERHLEFDAVSREQRPRRGRVDLEKQMGQIERLRAEMSAKEPALRTATTRAVARIIDDVHLEGHMGKFTVEADEPLARGGTEKGASPLPLPERQRPTGP